METKLTLTVKEMAALLQVSLPTAYQMTERADFPPGTCRYEETSQCRIAPRMAKQADRCQSWLICSKQSGIM